MSKWWKRRVFNYVRQQYMDPCDPNQLMYFQMAMDALYLAAISYATPNWKDEIDMLTGKSWLKHASGRLKEASKAAPAWASGTGEVLVPIAEGIDTALWVVMLGGILFDAFIDWGSAAYQVKPCDQSTDYIWGRSKRPSQFESRYDEWVQGPSWATDAGNVGPNFASTTVIPPGWSGYMAFGVNISKFIGFGEVTGYSTRQTVSNSPTIKEQHWTPKPGPSNKGPLMYQIFHPHPEERIVNFEVNVSASSHLADWTVYAGYAAFSFRGPGVPFKPGTFNRSGYQKSTLSVTDPF
jgi:hypothetical protein